MSPTGDLLVTFIFLWGRCPLELAQRPSRVALVLHLARRSTPFWVTILSFFLAPVSGMPCPVPAPFVDRPGVDRPLLLISLECCAALHCTAQHNAVVQYSTVQDSTPCCIRTCTCFPTLHRHIPEGHRKRELPSKRSSMPGAEIAPNTGGGGH